VLRVEQDEPHLVEPGPYVRERGGEFWVAERAGKIVATGAVKLHADCGEVKTIYVHPLARRQGLARRLTELAIEHARQAGRRKMILWSDTRFTKAHALYASMGFIRDGERDLHDSNHSREFGYWKAIPERPASRE
jgi:N-acetylglutamate synthase-like GNAT family acetyltransferase